MLLYCWVLILVLLDDGLGPSWKLVHKELRSVLILVLLDDGLGHCMKCNLRCKERTVLILVLLDDGLGLVHKELRSTDDVPS